LRQHHITFTRHSVPHFTSHHYLSNTLNQPYNTNIYLYRFLSGAGEIIKAKWWGYRGQLVGISRPSGGDIEVKGEGIEVKVKKVVGDIEVKWWGYRGQVVGISRSSGGDIKVKLWGYQGQGGGA
jgi:hypothetical protein